MRGAPAGDVLALKIDVKGGAAFVAELAETDGVSRAVRAHLAFDRQRASTRLAAARVGNRTFLNNSNRVVGSNQD